MEETELYEEAVHLCRYWDGNTGMSDFWAVFAFHHELLAYQLYELTNSAYSSSLQHCSTLFRENGTRHGAFLAQRLLALKWRLRRSKGLGGNGKSEPHRRMSYFQV